MNILPEGEKLRDSGDEQRTGVEVYDLEERIKVVRTKGL